ncbi:hypothetical protein [Kangiella sp. TOML190]|uniref:hypothetical protein n=1 Tax=Kangiella sp. TOML190 TaxID=2931351 RepID=UPI00203CDDC4|nr:hypothetical protein [Kangiella sp. TOML190]
MYKIILLVLMISFSMLVEGGTAQGKVKRIYPTGDDGKIFFNLHDDSCKSGSKYYYFNTDNQTGKNWYALLLSMSAQKQEVIVNYQGDCDPNISQPIRYIYVSLPK